MKRRDFLTSSVAGAAAAAIAAPAVAQTKSVVKWRMPTSWPKGLDILHGAAMRISERVAAMSPEVRALYEEA